MLKPIKTASAVLAGVAVASSALLGATAASATTAYENINYVTNPLGGDHRVNVGTLHDKISSLRNYGRTVIFYQDPGYLGQAWRTSYDYNNLTSVSRGLFGSWNDSIDSWTTVS